MELDVDERVELFAQLLKMSELAPQHGLPLRLIGGAAMQLWGTALRETRAMTSDLDWALTKEELPSQRAAIATLNPLVKALHTLGFKRPKNWRPSRSARFKFEQEGGQIDVEFLCGNLPFGSESRRDPAFKISPLDGEVDPPDFYAARTPWIDKIDSWTEVLVRGSMRTGRVWIPSIPSLALLKLKAVRDKLERLGEELDSERLNYERDRLQRHGEDFRALIRWSEERGEFLGVVDRVRSDDDVRDVVLEAQSRLERIDAALVHQHGDLENALTRIARIAAH